MPQASVAMNTRRVNATTSIIDIQGDVSAFAEQVLMSAYNEASTPTTRTIILNFSGLEYMNSSGIGLIVTLLIRVNLEEGLMHGAFTDAHEAWRRRTWKLVPFLW